MSVFTGNKSQWGYMPFSPKTWHFVYSVNFQTTLVFLFTIYLCLLAPFPLSKSENDHLNLIYDFIYDRFENFQLLNVKFSSLSLLGFVYGPTKLLTKLIPTDILPPINVLILMRIILSVLTISCWRFLQNRISFNFGSQVAFLFFISEIFNWNSLNQSSRFTEDTLIRSIVFLSLGLIIEKKYLLSLSFVCLTLPILREKSLNFLSSFLPLFLNREIFEKDPLAMFVYLSISGIVIEMDPADSYVISPSNFVYLKSPLMIPIIFTVLSGLVHRNFLVLKILSVHLIGTVLFETTLDNSIYFPLLSVAFALSFSQSFSKIRKFGVIHSNIESIGTQLFALFLSTFLIITSIKSTQLSPGGHAALHLNDFLISESFSCSGIIKTHVSKSAQSLGFSKFSSLIAPKIAYEFGTIYTDEEMLQKFKYRVADINENFDPAYWRVKRVISGISGINEKESQLQVKILARAQAE